LLINLKLVIEEKGICPFCENKCKGNGVQKCKNFRLNFNFFLNYFDEVF